MFGHQTVLDGVWSPNIYLLSRPLVLTSSECFHCQALLEPNPEEPTKHKQTLIINQETPWFAILLSTEKELKIRFLWE